jgi:hypothetical protein
MMIIGCDLHTRYQQIAMLDTETGELVQRRLEHENGEARAFYSALLGPVRSTSCGWETRRRFGHRVGIEATGYTHWFEDLLAELGDSQAENGRARCGAPAGPVAPGIADACTCLGNGLPTRRGFGRAGVLLMASSHSVRGAQLAYRKV